MKILAIGLGGAGCRITDALNGQSHRYTPEDYLQPLCVDSDSMCLDALHHVPVERRHLIAPLGMSGPAGEPEGVFAEEITAKAHSVDSGDLDAIIIFGGLGGHMLSSVPRLIRGLTSEFFEPVFCFYTLPSPDEGPTVSARAAVQIDEIMPLCEGVILLDNAIWKDRFPAGAGAGSIAASRGMPRVGRKRKAGAPEPGAEYTQLNSAIARRILLLLRAGEYHERPGSEIAETVLDAGEILNTIKGGGIITIGYAAERLRQRKVMDILSPLRIQSHRITESHERASRLVDLGIEAATNGMSVRCRLDSVSRALLLVAGPSSELSMKGYLLIRWWLNQAIQSGDVRAGDFPIPGAQLVGLILILAGVREIPRLAELRQFGETGVLPPQSEAIPVPPLPDGHSLATGAGRAQDAGKVADRVTGFIHSAPGATGRRTRRKEKRRGER